MLVMMIGHQVFTMELLQAAQEVPLRAISPEDKDGVARAKNCHWWTRLTINLFVYLSVFVFLLLC